MSNTVYSLLAVVLVSSISLLGVFTLTIKIGVLKSITSFLVALSVGTLIGDVFLHILPEGFASMNKIYVSFGLIAGILLFYILENLLNWRHCHVQTDDNHKHNLATANIVGDALHNFIDGIIIATSFTLSKEIGIATTIAVVLHEIPQEIGDFGVLIHAGLKRKQALFYNFLSALFAFLGVFVFYIVGGLVESFANLFLMIAAGGFLYIAIADLIPELRHTCNKKKAVLNIVFIVLGVLIMFLLTILE